MQLSAGPRRRRPWLLYVFFSLLFSSTLPLLVSCDELAVTSPPEKLRLPPGQLLEGSPGSKPGPVMACNRVMVRGFSRLRHLDRFFHSLKVKIDLVPVGSSSRVPMAEVCLHRNASIDVGMCSAGGWEKITKGTWVQTVSPFSDKIIDVRMQSAQSAAVIDISTEEELFLPRVFFLMGGFVLMALARLLSESVVFYYGSAMTIGIILVILMVLFQGMKLLPTGRRSSLAMFMYSSILGVGTFILHYLSGLLRSALVELGIGEDIHKPLVIFFLFCLFLAGAWLGFWGVRKLVLDEEGAIDQSVAYAVEWSIFFFSAVMILQSSLDTLLSTEALLLAILLTSIIRSRRSFWFLRRLFRLMKRTIRRAQTKSQYCERPADDDSRWTPTLRPFTVAPCDTASGPRGTLPRVPPEQETYYSTFHVTPERKKLSKEEWKVLTRDCTRRAMNELSSSPDFARWVANNAERITVNPSGSSSL